MEKPVFDILVYLEIFKYILSLFYTEENNYKSAIELAKLMHFLSHSFPSNPEVKCLFRSRKT